MTVNGLFYGLNSTLLLEMVSTQQAEVIIWVDMIQRKDQVDQGLPAVQSMLKSSGQVRGC